MYTSEDKPRPYSQLAAIQLGYLMDKGAISWDENAMAGNGTDKGAFAIDLSKMPAAVEALMKDVLIIKARNDVKGAKKLITKYVDGKVVPFETINGRFLRFGKASFQYAYDL